MPVKSIYLYDVKPGAMQIALLEEAGYTVHSSDTPLKLSELAELDLWAIVIDQAKMPANGRYVAAAARGAKKLRAVPVVFVDGDEAKLARTKAEFPDAVFTTRARLVKALHHVTPVENAVQPAKVMASDRPLAAKLGIRAGARVAVADPPAQLLKILGALPEGVEFVEDPSEATVALWFVRERETYLAGLGEMIRVATKAKLWVVYPKGQAAFTQMQVREAAIAVGLVDYKICRVDDVWTGLAFAVKK
jgi:CheY-like chemotaxis protein